MKLRDIHQALKNIGLEDNFKGLNKKNIIAGCIMSTVIGFYNGFFGPGTGSFLLFAFIKIYGIKILKGRRTL